MRAQGHRSAQMITVDAMTHLRQVYDFRFSSAPLGISLLAGGRPRSMRVTGQIDIHHGQGDAL
jgi:hypothetical protein